MPKTPKMNILIEPVGIEIKLKSLIRYAVRKILIEPVGIEIQQLIME